MANRKTTAPAYDPETTYAVKFVRPVRYRSAPLDALNEHEMSGAVLATIIHAEGADVVDRAEPR